MKLTIKTLQQKSFTIECEPTAKVADAKIKIQESQGFEPSHQKLIHAGKILADDAVLQDCNIQEKDFLVVMVTKPKAAPAAPVAKPVEKPTPVQPAASTPVPVPATSTPTPAVNTSAPAVSGPTDTSGLATGAAYESAVNNLVEMGFERSLVVRAMRAAFNNPDRAAEYLMTGIPESATRESPAIPVSGTPTGPLGTPAPTPTQPASGQPLNLFEAAAAQARTGGQAPAGTPAAGGDALGQLGMLRNSAQFQQLRQLIQAQPELIQPILQQLAQTSPEMMQLISNNPEQFMSLLNEGGEGGDFEEGEEGAEGAQYVTISAEDDAAINRLVGLGFDRNQAAEAFLACDKNEELAANYLFDSMGNDNW